MSLVSKVICDVCGAESGIPDKPSTWGAQGKVEIRFGASYYMASSHVDLCKRCYVEMQEQLREWLASMPPCFRGIKPKPAAVEGKPLNIAADVVKIFEGVKAAQREESND